MSSSELIRLLCRQLSFFGDLDSEQFNQISKSFETAVDATKQTLIKSTNIPSEFNFFFSLHHVIFLYKLARGLYLNKASSQLCEKLYLLNKMMNGIDLYYKIEMPKHFLIGHGLGIIFSKAKYSDYLIVFQNVTIGSQDGHYPVIGERVVIYPNSVVVGNTKIGNDCVIGAGTVLINKTIPDSSVVYQKNGILTIKKSTRTEIQKYFDI